MREVDQNLDALQHDVVRFLALDVRDESDAARVVFVPRRVQPLRLRQAQERIGYFHIALILRFGVAAHRNDLWPSFAATS